MNLVFHEAELRGIGAATSRGTGMAAKLLLSFMDKDAKLINHVNLDLFVTRSPDITLAAIQKEARTNAIAILKAALAALEKEEIKALQLKSDQSTSTNIDTTLGGDK